MTSDLWPPGRAGNLPGEATQASLICGAAARPRSAGPGQLGNPYSRASASWAAESVIRSETAWMRATACGSPSVAARSNSRAWRRSWSRSGRSGSSDMMSPRSPGSRLGSIRRRSCRKHDYRKNSGGGLRSCPRTQRRDHPVMCTFEVLLELVWIRASALLSSQFRSTFYGRRARQPSIPEG
jgi:hypothetical protein